MAEESREEVAFAEVLALGSGTRVLRVIATPSSVLLALLCFYLVVRARERLPPTTPPPPPQMMTVTLETLPPPPPPPPEPAKAEPAPKAPTVHAPRAPAAQPVADELDVAEVPQDDNPVPDVGPVMTALPGPGGGGGFTSPGEAYGTATHGVPGGHGKPKTKARPARATSYGWKCEWPSHQGVESAWVSLRVLVSHDGRPLVVETFDATAPVFAKVAKTCALEQEWLPALDDEGKPVEAYTHVIKVFFTH